MSSGEFTNVARGIVKESISSGIFIDDKTIMPFEEIDDEAGLDSPTELFNSFKERNCSLDIYRYDSQNWKNELDYILNNRDLIILDWQLEGDNPNYIPALRILEEAINSKNIHFICIYTKIPDEQLIDEVVYPILGYFCGHDNDFNPDQFREDLDLKGLQSDKIIAKLKELLKELAVYKNSRKKRGEVMRNLIDFSKEEFEGGIEEFKKFVTDHFKNFDSGLLELGHHLNNSQFRDKTEENDFYIRISKVDKEKTVFINQTVIKIRTKEEIKNDQLYDHFTESLLKEHNIFLTLLGLELRNLFRKSSAFIGKELEGVDELAFFHHHDQYAKEDTVEAFYEFLREIWRDQASSFLLEENPQLLKSLEEYKEEEGINEQLKAFENKGDTLQSLSTLNLVYNKLNVIRKENDIIRFGDVFYSENDDENKYFICLTPHCDCLRAESKINYHYFFTSGVEVSLSSGLERAETDYISFLKNKDDELVCVDWEECKPFSLYIPNNKIGSSIEVNFKNQSVELEHLCSIKENYAQRIANNAFSYPMRVGIVMANTKKAE